MNFPAQNTNNKKTELSQRWPRDAPYMPWESVSTSTGTFPEILIFKILIHQRYRQTDKRTDRRHAVAIPRFALHV